MNPFRRLAKFGRDAGHSFFEYTRFIFSTPEGKTKEVKRLRRQNRRLRQPETRQRNRPRPKPRPSAYPKLIETDPPGDESLPRRFHARHTYRTLADARNAFEDFFLAGVYPLAIVQTAPNEYKLYAPRPDEK